MLVFIMQARKAAKVSVGYIVTILKTVVNVTAREYNLINQVRQLR